MQRARGNFEDFLLPPPGPDDESTWDLAPTAAQLAEAEKWQSEQRLLAIRRIVDELLPTCVKIEGLERHYGVRLDINKSQEAVRSGHLIGLDLDTIEGSLWYPRWQFQEQAGEFTRNEVLLGLWQHWGSMQGVQFCNFVRRQSDSDTYMDIPSQLAIPGVTESIHRYIEASLLA